MRRRALLYFLLGCVLTLVLVAATAPAAWVAWGVARASDNKVLFDAPSGSVWQGQATVFLQGEHTPPQSLGAIGWRINPLWLVTGRLPVSLYGVDPRRRFQAEVELMPGKIAFRLVDVRVPASILPMIYSPALFFNFGGELRLTTPALELERGAVTGQAELTWQSATTSLSKVQPLGDYLLYLNGEGKHAAIKLETPRGALLIMGDGRWDIANGRFDFDGIARPLGRAADLEPLLRAFGRDQGAGQRQINLYGRLQIPGP